MTPVRMPVLTDLERIALGIDEIPTTRREVLRNLQTPSDAWFDEHFSDGEIELAELAVRLYVSNLKTGKL
jgi:hypothetical protein